MHKRRCYGITGRGQAMARQNQQLLTNESIREQLQNLADPKFQQFSSRLIPNINSNRLIGVRLPKLRKIAKQVAKQKNTDSQDWKQYLLNASDESFEEVMLQGMVIGYLKISIDEKLALVAEFLPKIDNWSTCDSFCAGLKIAKEYPERVWEFIVPYLNSDKEYDVRFGIVMIINYFSQECYIEKCLELIDKVKVDSYYVKMAVAWAVSIFYIKEPEKVMPYLKENNLDDFTYHKTLQKITESLQVDAEEKEKIRKMYGRRVSLLY